MALICRNFWLINIIIIIIIINGVSYTVKMLTLVY